MAPVTIAPESLFPLLRRFPAPTLLDVRREERWREAADILPGAIHRDPEAVAEATGAVPFDVENVVPTHRGDGCTFDTLIEDRGIADPALAKLALMVRGVDTVA